MEDSPLPRELTNDYARSEIAEPAPNIDSDFHPVDQRYIAAERLSSLILFIVVLLGSIITTLSLWLSAVEPILVIIAGVGMFLICVLLLWNAIFWPAIEYRNIGWKLSDLGLEIRKGVLWKHQTAVPWARAQHADVSQGPLQRMFEIGSLTVHTAGTKNSSVTIDGLAHSKALELRDEIIRQRKVHDVV